MELLLLNYKTAPKSLKSCCFSLKESLCFVRPVSEAINLSLSNITFFKLESSLFKT